jgi:hypothetical protein
VQAGTEIAGRYVLEKVLGFGGMGDVWQGTDRQLERPVGKHSRQAACFSYA